MEVNRIIQSSIYSHPFNRGLNFKGRPQTVWLKQGEFMKRPVVRKSATGLLSFVKSRVNSYFANIKRTYDHKVIFALIEKELYGENSIDSVTHDLDKLIMYLLGFPKSFVSRVHRAHSEHHIESGKKLNLRSVICDNIASSPVFKPEKKYSFRDYFFINKDLQQVAGLGEILNTCNFGENLNFELVKQKSSKDYHGTRGALNVLSKSMVLLLSLLG